MLPTGVTQEGGDAVDMHGAAAADQAAAEFRAGHAEHVTQNPQEGGVDRPTDAVDLD